VIYYNQALSVSFPKIEEGMSSMRIFAAMDVHQDTRAEKTPLKKTAHNITSNQQLYETQDWKWWIYNRQNFRMDEDSFGSDQRTGYWSESGLSENE